MADKKAPKKARTKKAGPSGGPGRFVVVLLGMAAVGGVSFGLGYHMAQPPAHPRPKVAHHAPAKLHPSGNVAGVSGHGAPHLTNSATPAVPDTASSAPAPAASVSATSTPHPVTPTASVTASPTPAPTATPTPRPVLPPESSTPSATPSDKPPAPAPSPKTVGRAAVIIDDFGNNYDDAEGFIHARIPLTLSVLPQLPYTTRIAEEGRANGKTIMLHLPLEPLSTRNPGPGTIRTSMSDGEICQLLATNLASVPEVEGVNNHEGSKATADPRVMHLVLEKLHDRHLFYVDSMTAPNSVAGSMAQSLGVPFTIRNVFLDNEDDDDKIREQITLLAQDARTHGTAVAIGHVRIRTLRCLLDMAPTLEAEGIKLVSIKDLLSEPR